MTRAISTATTKARAKVDQMNTGHEDNTTITTTKQNSHRTPLKSTKEKDVRKEKGSSAIRKAKVKAKVWEKAKTIKANETPPKSKNRKSPTTVNV
jgi:hypothetical protein